MQTSTGTTYNDEKVFTYANGFNMAVAFTAFDSDQEWILDPSIGELNFITYNWDLSTESSLEIRQLETSICTAEQLGLTEDRENAEFLPIRI